jgi:Carboxypeptidase regulatory-like domain
MRLNQSTRHWRESLLIAAMGLIILLCDGPARGQTTTATIRGTVYDEAGTVISGATVTAINDTTGLTRFAVSDASGRYLIPKLQVGSYTVAVEKEGFRRLSMTGITLQVDQIAEIDPKLNVGNISDSISITSEAPLVNTTTPAVGEVIDNKRIVDLPLNGRQFLQLATLTSGVTVSPNGGFGGQLAGFNGPRITSNGGREDQNYFSLDGVSTTDPFYGTLTLSPSVDAIQEFKVEQNLYSADAGRLGGAHINIVVKSGSNQLHGSVYEFLRNDILDARNFFDLKKPPFRQNQYGFAVGGPIIKNRTFFFGNFEGLRVRKGITVAGSVPTAAQRMGDLSTMPGTIRDPVTGQPFQGNIIPKERIDPAAAAILAYLALPNSLGSRNLIAAPSLSNNTDQFLVRIDHKLSDRDSLYGRFSFSNTTLFQPFGPLTQFSATTVGSVPGFGIDLTSNARNLVFNWTRTFTPNLVGEFKFGYNRVGGGQIQENSGNNFGQQYNIGNTAQTGPFSGYPRFQTGIFTDIGDSTSLIRRTTQEYLFGGDVSWTHGHHEIKFGGAGQWFLLDSILDPTSRGQFTFTGLFTGNNFADFLLGLSGTSRGKLGDRITFFRNGDLSFYFQDNWHITPRFTVNLGLRWEYFGSPSEKNDRLANFDPVTKRFILASQDGQVNTAQQVPGSQALLSRFFPFVTSSEAGLPRALYNRDLNDFAPRIGFAWDVFGNQKTVLRSGYGVFYNDATKNLVILQSSVPPFFQSIIVSSVGFTPAQASIHTVLIVPPGATPGLNPRDLNFRDGYVQQWNLTLQQSLTNNLVVEGRYVGSKGTKLYSNDFSFNFAAPGDPSTVTSRLPFPQFAPGTRLSSIASSSFNALQIRVTERFSRGLTFTSNYTYGKSLDDDSLGQSLDSGQLNQDPTNRRLEHGRSAFDVRHNFVANVTYDLPFRADGALKKLVEGWQLSGILLLETGRPFHVNVSGDRAGTGNVATQRPDVIADPNLTSSQQTPDRWFNTDALVLQPRGKVGTLPRSALEADGYTNFDFSVLKDTNITERFKVQFRAEFFNIFNLVNFGYPNNTFVPIGGINAPTGAKNANANLGKIFNALDPRVIQFGIKLLF